MQDQTNVVGIPNVNAVRLNCKPFQLVVVTETIGL